MFDPGKFFLAYAQRLPLAGLHEVKKGCFVSLC